MGRRALPKIDRQLDLTTHLLKIDSRNQPPGEITQPQPFDAQAIFGRVAPVEIEVGSGKGLFLRTASAAHSDRDFLGIEIVGKYARFIAAKLARDDQSNARIMHGDGVLFLQSVPDNSVSAVHVYFPDPWWKKRHRKRRVMNKSLINSVDRVLKPGGILHFWTDVKEYFESTLELMESVSKLDGPFTVTEETALHEMDYRTHFERRVRLNDLPVYRAEFHKPAWRVEFAAGPAGVVDLNQQPGSDEGAAE